MPGRDLASLAYTRRKSLILLVAAILAFFLFTSFTGNTHYGSIAIGDGVNQPPKDETFWPSPAEEDEKPPGTIDLNDGQFHWASLEQHYPVKTIRPLPPVSAHEIPRIQHTTFEEDEGMRAQRLARRDAVKSNFTHVWESYRKYAWLHDELLPVSGGKADPFGGWGATLVDSLDTLWIMGLYPEFDEAVKAIDQIDFQHCSLDEINVFETTIRYLGGFLSAYDLSGGKYPQLLVKAREMGDMLLMAFDTPNRLPITRWNFEKARSGARQTADSHVLVAEMGSLTLEFTRLSYATGDSKYYDAVSRIMDIFDVQQMKTNLPGMWPIVVNARDEDFANGTSFTISGMADSAYEYLPKQHLLMGGGTNQYRRMYDRAVRAMKSHIFYRPMVPDEKDILFAGQIDVADNHPLDELKPNHRAEHLGCFAGGMLAIGGKIFEEDEDVSVARKLTEGCLWGYEAMELGVMPEIMYLAACTNSSCTWDEEAWRKEVAHSLGSQRTATEHINEGKIPPGVVRVLDKRYILRPEAIESVFILYRITGDRTLPDRAWRMFENIVSLTKTTYAHTALDDCTQRPPTRQDRMESFWTAETLKYFYLVFSEPELVSLDEYVFNTEAHPLRRPSAAVV